MKKVSGFIVVLALLTAFLGLPGCKRVDNQTAVDSILAQSMQKYNEAVRLYGEEKLLEALEAFKQVDEQDREHYADAQNKIEQINEQLFESYVNQAKEYYNTKEYDKAVSSLETALLYRDSQPVRELLEHYKDAGDPKEHIRLTPEEKKAAMTKMQTYEGGEGSLKIALDNIYTREFIISNIPIEVSDDTVFLKLWVNIINEGTKDIPVKPEYIKLYTQDGRAHAYHPEYSKHLDIPFTETLLPPNGRASGRVLILIPLESSYRFEYDDGINSVTKTVIPY